jgi:hypothetical protein
MKIFRTPQEHVRRHPTAVLCTLAGITAFAVYEFRCIGTMANFLKEKDLLDEAFKR